MGGGGSGENEIKASLISAELELGMSLAILSFVVLNIATYIIISLTLIDFVPVFLAA